MTDIAVLIGSRANWASCAAVVRELESRRMPTTVVCFASALSDMYGHVADRIEDAGHSVVRATSLVAGGDLADMVATSAMTLSAVGGVLDSLQPSMVYAVGDRYEVLPAVYAASLLNIPVAHQMGGELTGTIDEHVRHAITKLSHVHLVATAAAKKRVVQMGERRDAVHLVGCPRLDLCRTLDQSAVGEWADVLVVAMHPVTSEVYDAGAQMAEVIGGVISSSWSGPVHMFWPNSDAGAQEMVHCIRRLRPDGWHTHRNMEPERYLAMLAGCRAIVGNSSSAIREGAYLGTPAVNVGSRQCSRERGPNVIDAPPSATAVAAALDNRLSVGRTGARSELYGDGNAAAAIVSVLARGAPESQKVWAS